MKAIMLTGTGTSRPMEASQRVNMGALKAPDSVWPKLLVSWGVFLQVVSGYWDVFSHRVQFISSDPVSNPAHLSLYSGVLMVLIGIFAEKRFRDPGYNTLMFPAARLIVVGTALEIISGVWNELWHLFSLPEPPIAPAHAFLVIGMLTVNIGIVIDLSLIYWAMRQKENRNLDSRKAITQVSLIIAFTSVWLLSSGSLIYSAGVVNSAEGYFAILVAMAVVSTLVIIPAMLALDRTGFATSIGVGYNFVNYLLIVVYAGRPTYVPLGLIPLLAVDLVHGFLGKAPKTRRPVFLVGIVLGVLLPLTYYPYSFPLLTVAPAPNLSFILLVSVLGSLVGGVLGYKIVGFVSSLASRNFSKRVSAG